MCMYMYMYMYMYMHNWNTYSNCCTGLPPSAESKSIVYIWFMNNLIVFGARPGIWEIINTMYSIRKVITNYMYTGRALYDVY